MKLQDIFKQIGFSSNKTRIYLASLQTGVASAQDIAKQAGLKRTTAYSVLDHLTSRGFIGKTKSHGKTRYVAISPDKLLDHIKDVRSDLEKALPELEAMYNKKETKPKIIFYEGEKAIHNVYEDTLKEKPTEILEWNTNAFFERFPTEYNYIQKRVTLGIKARRIAGQGSLWDTAHKQNDLAELAETVIVPNDKFDPQIEVNIYNNKVAFMNYAESMSVIIESKPIADAMRQAYELSWKGAKKS